jgi:hypothetical protein
MHYLIGVILPFKYDGDKLHEAVGEVLKPWDENDNENGHWDWWQLGGRWTGTWSEYDPEQDPANQEACWLCHGTGLRDDEPARRHRAEHPEYTCNGCANGPRPGIAVKWPTKWVKRPDLDVIPVTKLLVHMPDNWDPNHPSRLQPPYAIAAAPDLWRARETWDGNDFVVDPDWPNTLRTTLTQFHDCYIAAVDIHT